MNRKPLFAALIAAAFALPMGASANNTAKHTGEKVGVSAANNGHGQLSFSSVDTNGDGYISKDELAAASNQGDLSKLDTNGDGKISAAEYAAANGGTTSTTANASSSATAPANAATASPGNQNNAGSANNKDKMGGK